MFELALAAALAAAVLMLVTGPLRRRAGTEPELDDPPPVEETRQGQALLAIKDLEFDHATAKISDEDYQVLRSRFTQDALAVLSEAPDAAEALVAERRLVLDGNGAPPPVCPSCGPRPEADARFCSSCGLGLAPPGGLPPAPSLSGAEP